MKIYVIVGVYAGCANTVVAKSSQVEAINRKRLMEHEFSIEADTANDVQLFEVEVDGSDGDMILGC